MVSSTVGSLTNTGWKRRARAASFSTCLRYSSSVVAPTQCSSPRARAGLSRLEASIAPSVLPAPTRVCISSMNRMIEPSAAVISLSTAFSRSSNSPRYFAPAIRRAHVQRQELLVLQALGHVAVDDAQGQALDDGGLADAGLADQHGIVLGAARQDLDGAADLLVAADHRVELAVAGGLGQVAGVALEGVIAFLGRRRCRRCGPCAPRRRRSPGLAAVAPGVLQRLGGVAAFLGDGDQQALGGDEGVAGLLGAALRRRGTPGRCRASDRAGPSRPRPWGLGQQGGLGRRVRRRAAAGALDQVAGQAVPLVEQGLRGGARGPSCWWPRARASAWADWTACLARSE